MLPAKAIEHHFSFLDPERLDILLEVRSIVASVAPGATERIDHRGISYYDRSRGGPVKAGICQIWIEPDHLRVAFIHGVFLPDPHHLLEGERLAKRYLRIYSYDRAPWAALRGLIAASASFDPAARSTLLSGDKNG